MARRSRRNERDDRAPWIHGDVVEFDDNGTTRFVMITQYRLVRGDEIEWTAPALEVRNLPAPYQKDRQYGKRAMLSLSIIEALTDRRTKVGKLVPLLEELTEEYEEEPGPVGSLVDRPTRVVRATEEEAPRPSQNDGDGVDSRLDRLEGLLEKLIGAQG